MPFGLFKKFMLHHIKLICILTIPNRCASFAYIFFLTLPRSLTITLLAVANCWQHVASKITYGNLRRLWNVFNSHMDIYIYIYTMWSNCLIIHTVQFGFYCSLGHWAVGWEFITATFLMHTFCVILSTISLWQKKAFCIVYLNDCEAEHPTPWLQRWCVNVISSLSLWDAAIITN